jgi:hypothetical protein
VTIELVGPKVETLTIRIPMRLQRRKLIVTQEGTAMPSPKPRRDADRGVKKNVPTGRTGEGRDTRWNSLFLVFG